MRKPKAILETQLTDERQVTLCGWLMNGGPLSDYRTAALQVEKEFGLKVGKDAVATFYHNVCVPLMLQRKARAAEASDILASDPATDRKVTTSLISQLKQRAFEILLQPNPDPKEIVCVISQALKARDQDQVDQKIEQKNRELAQNDRKLKLMESKLHQAKEEVKKLRDKGAELNEEERTVILDKVDEILGIK